MTREQAETLTAIGTDINELTVAAIRLGAERVRSELHAEGLLSPAIDLLIGNVKRDADPKLRAAA